MKFPVIRGNAKKSISAALSRAVARLRNQERETQEARLNCCTLHSCSTTNQRFAIHWRLNPDRNVYEVQKVEKLHEDGSKGSRLGKRTSFAKHVGDELFDHAGRYCPWCGYSGGFVYCGCGEFVCGHTKHMKGADEWFRHEKCGRDFELVSMTSIPVHQGQKGRGASPVTKLITNQSGRLRLPGK